MSSSMVPQSPWKRLFFLILGFICLVLGVLGVILPVMPGLIFFVAAVACFARSSERLHRWLTEHRFFGKFLKSRASANPTREKHDSSR